jgi:hypothetical protein
MSQPNPVKTDTPPLDPLRIEHVKGRYSLAATLGAAVVAGIFATLIAMNAVTKLSGNSVAQPDAGAVPKHADEPNVDGPALTQGVVETSKILVNVKAIPTKVNSKTVVWANREEARSTERARFVVKATNLFDKPLQPICLTSH